MEANANARTCLNCGRETGPAFCRHCGQEAEIRQGPILGVAREVLSDWLALDSRLLRSLRELVRPGRSSELYVAGKRAPFLRPFRLYLLASVVLFSTVLTLEAPTDSSMTLKIGGRVVEAETEGGLRGEISFLGRSGLVAGSLRRLAGDRIDRLVELPRQEVLELLFAGMRRMLPTTLILFVPFLGLGLKLLYVRGKAKRTQYLDHLVFALHFQSALFFALTLAWMGTRVAGAELLTSAITYAAIGMAMLFVYLPLALRRFYAQAWVWTVAKTFAVMFFYSQLVGLAVDLSVLLAIWRV